MKKSKLPLLAGAISHMRVKWTRRATKQLNDLKLWLSSIEGANPKRIGKIIRNRAILLERLGDIGRPSQIEGTRELSVHGAPYVIVYMNNGDDFLILSVFHTAQDR